MASSAFSRPSTSPLVFSRYCNLSYVGFSNGAPDVCASFASSTTCGVVNVPTDWFRSQRYCETCLSDGSCEDCTTLSAGSGVPQADMVLMISAQDTEACLSSSSTLAWAVPCQRDQHDRPVLGAVNFAPLQWTCISGPAWEGVQISTAQHEIAHALVSRRRALDSWDRDTILRAPHEILTRADQRNSTGMLGRQHA